MQASGWASEEKRSRATFEYTDHVRIDQGAQAAVARLEKVFR